MYTIVDIRTAYSRWLKRYFRTHERANARSRMVKVQLIVISAKTTDLLLSRFRALRLHPANGYIELVVITGSS